LKAKYTLFTPGPTHVPDDILAELSKPLVYHREASFVEILSESLKGLKRVFKTKSDVYVFTASGTGAMEAAASNLLSPGDNAIVAICGKFGERWRELVLRYGAYAEVLQVPFGKSVPVEELERKIKSNDNARFVFTTLTETSTGAVNDIKSFGHICRANNRILVVDAIAGLGADELCMDEWQVDVVCGAAQKALYCPPGLSFIAFNDRAWEIAERNRSPRFYFDLRQYRKWLQDKGQTPWTPAISLFYCLNRALGQILEVGMEEIWARHKRVAEYTRKCVADASLEILPEHPSNALTVIKMPEGIDGSVIVTTVKERDKMLLANGQAEMFKKIVRIGHMGCIGKPEVTKAFEAFLKAFKEQHPKSPTAQHPENKAVTKPK
jgi:serine---pyruvate transaminase